jgi:hypothetical protein
LGREITFIEVRTCKNSDRRKVRSYMLFLPWIFSELIYTGDDQQGTYRPHLILKCSPISLVI